MSCCNNRPVIVYPPCTSDCPEPDAVVAQNDNLAGYGVLDRQEGQSLYFRGISAKDNYITVDINADDKTVEIGLSADLIDGTIPDASESTKGKIALATSVEVLNGLEDSKAVTPLNLSLLSATVARRGMVELATSIEAAAGIDSERAVTPSALNFTLANYKQTKVFANAAARAVATPDFEGQTGVQLDTGAIYRSDGLSAGDWDVVNLDGPTISNTVNFVGSTWQLNSVSIPANSVLITGGSAGTPSSKLLSDFMSMSSTTADYTTGSITETRTFDSSSTLTTMIDVVATLISDLSQMHRVRTV